MPPVLSRCHILGVLIQVNDRQPKLQLSQRIQCVVLLTPRTLAMSSATLGFSTMTTTAMVNLRPAAILEPSRG